MDPAERRWDEHGMQAVFGKARVACTARPGARRGLLSCDHPFAFMALLGFLCLIGEINAQTAAGIAPFNAMAVTIMCGPTFATVLVMVVLPVNYAFVCRIPNPPKRCPPAPHRPSSVRRFVPPPPRRCADSPVSRFPGAPRPSPHPNLTPTTPFPDKAIRRVHPLVFPAFLSGGPTARHPSPEVAPCRRSKAKNTPPIHSSLVFRAAKVHSPPMNPNNDSNSFNGFPSYRKKRVFADEAPLIPRKPRAPRTPESDGGDDRPAKPFGKKPFARKPFGKKPFGKKPFGKKPFARKPFDGNFADDGDDAPFDGPFDAPAPRRPFAKKPFGKKPFGKKTFGKKPFRRDFDESSDDVEAGFAPRRPRNPFGDDAPRKPFSGKPRALRTPYGVEPSADDVLDPALSTPESDFSAEGFSDGPAAQNDFARKPFARKPFKKPFGKKPFGKKPFAKKPFGKKPFAKKPFARKPFDDDFADGDAEAPFAPPRRPFGKKPFGKKPFGKKTFARKPRFGEEEGGGFGAPPRKPFSGKKPFGKKPFGKPFAKKSFGKKPFGKKPFGKSPRKKG